MHRANRTLFLNDRKMMGTIASRREMDMDGISEVSTDEEDGNTRLNAYPHITSTDLAMCLQELMSDGYMQLSYSRLHEICYVWKVSLSFQMRDSIDDKIYPKGLLLQRGFTLLTTLVDAYLTCVQGTSPEGAAQSTTPLPVDGADFEHMSRAIHELTWAFSSMCYFDVDVCDIMQPHLDFFIHSAMRIADNDIREVLVLVMLNIAGTSSCDSSVLMTENFFGMIEMLLNQLRSYLDASSPTQSSSAGKLKVPEYLKQGIRLGVTVYRNLSLSRYDRVLDDPANEGKVSAQILLRIADLVVTLFGDARLANRSMLSHILFFLAAFTNLYPMIDPENSIGDGLLVCEAATTSIALKRVVLAHVLRRVILDANMLATLYSYCDNKYTRVSTPALNVVETVALLLTEDASDACHPEMAELLPGGAYQLSDIQKYVTSRRFEILANVLQALFGILRIRDIRNQVYALEILRTLAFTYAYSIVTDRRLLHHILELMLSSSSKMISAAATLAEALFADPAYVEYPPGVSDRSGEWLSILANSVTPSFLRKFLSTSKASGSGRVWNATLDFLETLLNHDSSKRGLYYECGGGEFLDIVREERADIVDSHQALLELLAEP